MLEGIFNFLHKARNGSLRIAAEASCRWRVLFMLLSSCHLSSIPLKVGFISAQGKMSFARTFKISLVVSVGILITFALIGTITASFGSMVGDLGGIGNFLVAGIFSIVGLFLVQCTFAYKVPVLGIVFKRLKKFLSINIVFACVRD
ncbi:MAG: cytochrome c-type bioproteinis protein [Stygiobacter sp.]|nr:MAG: cytochrome c-type bioproteinis protein [Stygiobacter sp.]